VTDTRPVGSIEAFTHENGERMAYIYNAAGKGRVRIPVRLMARFLATQGLPVVATAEKAVLDAATALVVQQDTGEGINRDFYDAFDALRKAVRSMSP
jgi:hypothetical protein